MDEAELVEAIETNAAELLMTMGAAGGGEQREDGGVRWTIGGSPIDYHNAVVEAELEDSATADQVVGESLARMKELGVPGCWHVGPSMRPADLGERLVRAGFTYGGAEPGMAVELANLIEPTATGGLEIVRVADDETLAVWAETLGRGFGEGEKEARWVAEVYRREGYGDPWRHYLGLLDGEPVATTTVFLAAGVAGVYFVMTVPEARRRGIGAAITLAALREARDSGFAYGVLGSSPAGKSVYESLGFREYCSIDLYEWSAATD
ncbi:GNAT family N-acetyltransferase [Kribbella qitaiheensis]|uniref:GNAT family N-acetyltransferase n=1 Tax=Kribbella qitaiheensis TaxID=1544730 RepID=A0A7G6WWN0_9ACTN|nr:GNAT family N-acetyltransferase [Kribbella qitaiheensis]QNE18395.1 GNAT family N-acetyltransferase [Kribbella qitaiheensis]